MAEIPLIMPKMSMTMEEGTVVSWHKAEGDTVNQGDVVAEVLTDKVDMEVEATHDGVLSRIVAQVDDVVKVGDPIGYIESEQDDLLGDLFGDSAAEPEAEGSPAETVAEEESPAEAEAIEEEVKVAEETAPTEVSGIIPASPLARKLAREADLELSAISATGPHGTVRVSDVRAAIDQAPVEQAPAEASPAASEEPVVSAEPAVAPSAAAAAPVAEPKAEEASAPAVATGELYGDKAFQRSRKAVTRSMQPSTEVPQFTAYRSLDLEAMALARKTGLKGVSWTTIMVRVLAMAIRQYPQMNGYWTDEGLIANEDIGVTLAVDTEHGLMVPVFLNPDQQSPQELQAELLEVVEQARNKRMDIAKLKKATTTVSNMGGLGVDRFNALITPPQATALSMGAIQQVPVLNEFGQFVPKMVIQVGLTVDHRVGDGADAARILQTMADLLADPITFVA